MRRSRPGSTRGTAPESRSAWRRPRVCAAPSSRENHRPPVPSPPPRSRPPPRTDRRLPSCKRTRALLCSCRVRVVSVRQWPLWHTRAAHGRRAAAAAAGCCSSRSRYAIRLANTIFGERGGRIAHEPHHFPTPRRLQHYDARRFSYCAAATVTVQCDPDRSRARAKPPERARRQPSPLAARHSRHPRILRTSRTPLAATRCHSPPSRPCISACSTVSDYSDFNLPRATMRHDIS